MKRFLITGCLLLTAACSSRAQMITGNKLLHHCQDEKNGFAQGLCDGYIMGVSQMDAWNPHSEFWNIPDEVTVGQVRDTVVKYLADNPELRTSSAFVLTVAALTKAFPGRTPIRLTFTPPEMFKPPSSENIGTGIVYPMYPHGCEVPKSADY